ncbi:unnamed protein product [Lymnaea stagnalis]|uniref:Peptidase M14 domain-containing protein n=1 Tax=Lymnaea stagnalis TaxID=6523 RepID=A0AAV2IB44_LYMST
MPPVKCIHLLVQMVLFGALVLFVAVSHVSALDFSYHDEYRLGRVLRNLSTVYPNMTRLYSIGKSVRGRELWVLAIGKYAVKPALLVPNVKYIANMHGNEVVGRELLLHLADHYLSTYQSNETIRTFLDTTTVHLLPSMNPDGFSKSQVNDCEGITGRNNAYDYDLNRNFPDKNYRGRQPALQQETSLVMQWINATHFLLSANLHGGAMVVNYPFDASLGEHRPRYVPSPDDDVYRHISLIYSRSHANMFEGKSCADTFPDGITNGASWYPVLGGMQDYMYQYGSGYEVLVELSCCKYPNASELKKFWLHNRDALVNFLLAAHMGVKGLILGQASDSKLSFQPLEGAVVVVKGREGIQFSSTSQGEYYKLLLPGDYVLVVSHPEYRTESTSFTVQDGQVTRLDVRLFLNATSVSDNSSAAVTQTWLHCGSLLIISVLWRL